MDPVLTYSLCIGGSIGIGLLLVFAWSFLRMTGRHTRDKED
jgi:hypothetical protein